MSSVEKAISKFISTIDNGSAYEAQQFIKTVYHRLRSRKLLDESRNLLTEAVCIQFQHNEARLILPLQSSPSKYPHVSFHAGLFLIQGLSARL